MLPNNFYEGDDLKRDVNHLTYSSSKKEQQNFIQQEKNLNNFAHHNYDDFNPNGGALTKRHNRIIGSSINDLAMLSKSSHHPLLPSHHGMPGAQNMYQQPGYFDPRHHVPNVFSQGQHVGGNFGAQQHRHVRGDRDATLLHHLGRMSPQEQLNKFLISVEREQELRQMKESKNDLGEEKSPRDRRRRRQLLKRMTDGLQSKHQNNNAQGSDKSKISTIDNEYAVIDKKKISNIRRDSVNNGNEPIRWMSLNGINKSLDDKDNKDRMNGHDIEINRSNDEKYVVDNLSSVRQNVRQFNKNKDELEKRKSVAHPSRYRERTDGPKSFASMSQLDNLLKGKSSDSESDENDGCNGTSFYLNSGKDRPDVLSSPQNLNSYSQKPVTNDSIAAEPGLISHNLKMQDNNALSITSSVNSESGMNEQFLLENRHQLSSKDGKLTWNERKKLSLSMLKAKFSHKTKTSDILQSDHSSLSQSPNSMAYKESFRNQRNKSISPIDKMSTGSDELIKSGISTNSSARGQGRYTNLVQKEEDKMVVETDVEDEDEYNRMDGTDFSCSCTDVTLDDKYKITHKHIPAASSSNYNNSEKRDIGSKKENKEIEEEMIQRNIGIIENTNTDDKRQMMESEEHMDGSRSLDNITAGYTNTSSKNLEDQQPFFSLNDSTTATKVKILMTHYVNPILLLEYIMLKNVFLIY